MQVGQKVTIHIYTLIHVPYVGRTKSHNMYTPRLKTTTFGIYYSVLEATNYMDENKVL